MCGSLRTRKFPLLVCVAQILFILFFALFVEYEDAADPRKFDRKSPVPDMYPLFQDIHVMIFVGIAFLYTYLRRYGYSGSGYNFVLGTMSVEWTIIVRAFVFGNLLQNGKVQLSLGSLLIGDFNAAIVLISFGAVIGKLSPLQLIIMMFLELIISNLNELIGVVIFQVSDIGASMFIHVFAAYFGIAVSRMVYKDDHTSSRNYGTGYHSDLFTLIGTLFLWCFWPSFNGVMASEDERLRAITNTLLSLTASVVVTMAMSSFFDRKGKFEMSHVQNATLAGGVAIGTCANMPVQPWGAMTIGSLSAIISVIGYKYVSPILERKLKLHDPAGVNNLHGMPGILAAIAGVITAALSSKDNFGPSLYELFPACAPIINSTEYEDLLRRNWTWIEPGLGRTSGQQAGYQMAALVVSMCTAIVGGLLTGLILRFPVFDNPKSEDLYTDERFWNISREGFPNKNTTDDNELLSLENGHKNRLDE